MSTSELPAPRPRAGANFPWWHEAVLALLLVGGLAWAANVEPRFASGRVQLELASESWPLGLVAIAMAAIVITGGIDLSVGSMTALAAVAIGLAIEAGVNAFAAAAIGVATAACAGLINGALVARVGIHPLIVTLATMAGYRGVALAATQGRTIQGFPPEYAATLGARWLGAPAPAWLFAAVAATAAIVLARTAYGRFLYAIGHNESAARLTGVPVARMKLTLYVLSGVACGVAAVLLTARYEQAKADFGTGLELEVITAVVMGGISIFGGRGSIVGLLLGLILLHECNRFVPWHWHVSELNSLVTGGLLIGSVLLNSLIARRR